MQDNTARTIATVAIWAAVAIVLTFGAFRVNWDGYGVVILLGCVVAVCTAAGYGTVAVWGQLAKPAPEPPVTEPPAKSV